MNQPPNTPVDPPTTPVWQILAHALDTRRSVAATYHNHRRVLCPHALGYSAGRAKLLAYQTSGPTSTGALPADPHQRWRSLFLDDIEHPVIIDAAWQTADNYTPTHANGIEILAIAVNHPSGRNPSGPHPTQ